MKFWTTLMLIALLAAPVTAGPEYDEIRAKLNTMTISIDFDDAPLPDVIDFFRDYADINIVIDQSVFDEKSEDELTVSMTLNDLNLKTTLKLVLNMVGLKATYKEGVILIVTEDYHAVDELIVKVYDVRDLLMRVPDFPGPQVELVPPNQDLGGAVFDLSEEKEPLITEEFIEEMIREHTGGGSWDDNPNCSLALTENGQLLVTQSTAGHREILALLGKLRPYK
jgi:type II secretory pathway component GspD/PulD (secretin)